MMVNSIFYGLSEIGKRKENPSLFPVPDIHMIIHCIRWDLFITSYYIIMEDVSWQIIVPV